MSSGTVPAMPFEIRETWVGFLERGVCYRTDLDVGSVVILSDDYAHDGVRVHYGRYQIDADPATITVVEGGWARDARRVFHAGVAVAGADPVTFRPLSPVYGRDDRGAFCRSRPVEAAEVDSFAMVAGDYGRDARHVFDCGNVLAGADPATFRVLDAEWSADAGHVYRYGTAQPSLDPAGFAVHGPYLCHGGSVWYGGRPVAADAATFVGLGGDFGTDGNRHSRRYRTSEDEQLWLLAAAAFGDAEAAEFAADPHGLSDRAQRTIRTRLVDMLTTGNGLPQDPARAATLPQADKRKRPKQ